MRVPLSAARFPYVWDAESASGLDEVAGVAAGPRGFVGPRTPSADLLTPGLLWTSRHDDARVVLSFVRVASVRRKATRRHSRRFRWRVVQSVLGLG